MPDGVINGAFLVALGDEDIRDLDGLQTKVQPGVDIIIVMAVAGG
jgi:hypothetical protein